MIDAAVVVRHRFVVHVQLCAGVGFAMETPLACRNRRGWRFQLEYRRRGILNHAQAAYGTHLALRPGDPAADMPVIVARTECAVPERSTDYVIVDDAVRELGVSRNNDMVTVRVCHAFQVKSIVSGTFL